MRGTAARLRAITPAFLVDGGGLLLLVSLTAVSAGNFLFHVVVSRQLDPASYGALGALLGIVLVLAVPAGALQVAITREVAVRRRGDGGTAAPVVVGPLLAEAVVWGAVGCAGLLLAVPLVTSLLHLPSSASAVLLAAYVVPAAIGVVPKAVLLGEMRFRLVATGLLLGAATRLVLGAVLVRRGAGIEGAMAATVIGELVTAAVLLPGLRATVHQVDGAEPLRVRWSDTSTAIVAFTGFWLLTTVDTLLARRSLPRQSSGLYAAAATAARAAMFLPAAITVVVFPRFAASRGVGAAARRTLLQALAVVSALGFGTALGVWAAPGVVVDVLFGQAYQGSTTIVGLLALSSACLGLITVLAHFHLAARRPFQSSLSWLGVVFVAVAVVAGPRSLTWTALVMLAGTTGVMVAMLAAALSQRSVPREQASSYRARELWSLPGADLDLTMVVPYYNPGPRLTANLGGVLEVLGSSGATFEVVAVSDGSTDGSDVELGRLAPGTLKCVTLSRNSGKGAALRAGLALGRGRYLGFIDGDGDIDPSALLALLAVVRSESPDVVLGSKRHPQSEVHYPPLRRVYSFGFQQLVRALFRLNIRDTQTGLKLVRREVLAEVLPRMAEKRFAFDLELLVVARRLGHHRFAEAPVRIGRRFSSTISARAVAHMAVDTLAIFFRLRLLRAYDEPPSDLSDEGPTPLTVPAAPPSP